jgi:Ca2+/Na+ antiporter
VFTIIGMFSDVTFESNILSRDFLVLSLTSILFILITATYSSSRFNLKVIKLIGCIFVAGYLGYVLKLSNFI